MTAGLYIHIPFCAAKCDYCSFYSIPVEGMPVKSFEAFAGSYFTGLVDELDFREHLHGTEIDTVYFGGGTPSIIPPSLIKSFLERIRSRFQLLPGAEISIECNPEDFSVDLVSRWISLGINRITLGIQSFSPRLRSIIGRRGAGAQPRLLESFMSLPGFVHGVDLITAIHGSEEKEFLEDLKQVIEFRPEHVSTYMLSVEEGTPLSRKIRLAEDMEEEQRRRFETTMDTLVENGYVHYEISNFCLPSFESRHNSKYWKFNPYIGLGVRAHSFIGGNRCYNDQSLDEYLAGPSLRLDQRGENSVISEYLMMALRLMEGFTEREFEKITGVTIPASVFEILENKQKLGLMDIRKNEGSVRFKLTRKGIFWSDSILYDIVEPLL